MIYNPDKVQRALVPSGEMIGPTGPERRVVGIDWGRFAVAILA
jgi:hypothetical protein